MTSEKPKVSQDGYYGHKQACRLLGCSENTLRKYRKEGLIPFCYGIDTKPRYTGKAIIQLWRYHFTGGLL